MRRTIPLLVLALLATACGGGEPASDPASLESCEAVAAAAIGVIQDSIDIVDQASTTGEEPDEALAESLAATGAALEERASVLGCSEEQIAEEMAVLVDTLHAESVFGQLIIEGLNAGEGAFFDEG